MTTRCAAGMSRKRGLQEGAAPPPSLRRLRSTPPVSLRSARRVPACRADRSVPRDPGWPAPPGRSPPIVTHAHAELLVVVADVDFDPPGVRMPEGIPKGFGRNLVNLVTNDRGQIARLALDRHTEAGGWRALASFASSSPRVLIATARSLRSAVDARKPCTASRPSVIAFAACSIAMSSLFFASAGRSGSSTTRSEIAAADRESSEAACRAAPAQYACARRRVPRA